MTVKRINIPFELDLVKANSWNQLGKNQFYIIRLHLHIEELQAEDATYPGEIVASYHTTGKLEIHDTVEKALSITSVDETIRSQMISEELVTIIESGIKAGLNNPLYELSSEVKMSLQEKISKNSSFLAKESASITKTVTEKFEVTQTLESDGVHTYHAVTCYKPIRCNVYLHYIDYLVADYRTTYLGLRKKKKNMPRPEGNKHINRIITNQPLFVVKYWELLQKSSNIYSEEQYKSIKKKVLNPDVISIEDLVEPINLYLPERPERPTLYTLSNIAFPYLWIHRKGNWTVEDLKQIEFNDAEGSGWWLMNGPGRSMKTN